VVSGSGENSDKSLPGVMRYIYSGQSG